jgi:class 3 adenylate cyclase/tetratricopeptide (TPR) repeat protein
MTFCIECATRLSVACPACGQANPPAAKFCGGCATPLVAGDATSPPTTSRPGRSIANEMPVAERRLVSVLFADLVGFTPFAEERDAEDVRDTLTRYFDIATDVIARYGGTVEKFIGDAVMAVWGAPTAHEDDAERAVRAALDLVDAVQALGPTIKARAGVLTGEAAVTLGATNQGMVAGDLVNTAARLQSVAQPGTVLVGEPTMRAASAAIAFEEAGEQVLKGKVAPVAAYRALRVVAERGGRNRSDSLEAPFVGRDEELRLLKDLFHATGRERRARLVSVIGPAGIGKSRLAWEFLKYIDGLVETVWFHDGRSPAYGDGISFWALGEMVRRRAGLLETDDERTTRTKITETVARHVPDEGERRWIEPALLVLLGVETGIGSGQLFAAWRTFFERLAATAPVVMVFEDFHHADSGLLDFVDHLLEWSRNLPITVITLSRPELLDRRPDWGAGKRNFTSLYLEPLDEVAMRELLLGLVPGLPESALRSIVARADGIPLYAVETVRMLLADGRLERAEGAYRPSGNLTELAVPDTLTALIAARLDGLDPVDRSLLQDAAVLGQSFTIDGLTAVSNVEPRELETRVHALVRRELLSLEADPRSPERGQYAFVQALIREVAYNTLAKTDRKVRHLAAARYFEGLGSDELAGGLAGHYLAAFRNAPPGPEADALASQARIALKGAADRAAALGAHDQAVSFCEQALAVTTDPAEEAALLERAGSEASIAGDNEAAEGYVRRALELRAAGSNRVALCRASGELGRILLNAYRTEPALRYLEESVERFGDIVHTPEGVALVAQLARAQFLANKPNESVETADRVLASAERLDLPRILADLLITKGSALVLRGRRREGLGVIEVGRGLAESAGFVDTTIRALVNLSGFGLASDPRTTLATAKRGIDLVQRLGVTGSLVNFREIAGEAALRLGDWDWAVEELIKGLDLREERMRVHSFAPLSVIRILRGEPSAALLAETARILAGETDPQALTHLPQVRLAIALVEGQADAAEQAYREWEAILPDSEGNSLDAARVALWGHDGERARGLLDALAAASYRGPAQAQGRAEIAAGLHALEGRPEEARSAFREVLRGWHDLGLAWDEALTGIDMATLLDPVEPEVGAAAESAHEILARLGAKPFLARLEAAIQQPSPSVPERTRA